MGTMHVMENERLRVSVSDKGAEIRSIYDKKKEREALWTGDPTYWKGQAPVLFPFVGKVTGGAYTYEGEKYPIKQHGFARDMDFALVSAEADCVVHRLTATEETKKVYPFDFELELVHRLEGNRITVEWHVKNRGDKTMYFSIGGHPGFIVGKKTGCLITFDGQEELTRSIINLETGCMDTTKSEVLKLKDGAYEVEPHSFDVDALVFDNAQVKKVGIISAEGEKLVTMYCPDALSLGVWSKPQEDAPFICLEPWIGRCDNDGFAGELKDKFNEQALEAGAAFDAVYDLVIEE